MNYLINCGLLLWVIAILVGLVGLEPTTPALSRRCSNQLSYRPLSLPSLSPLTSIRTQITTQALQLLILGGGDRTRTCYLLLAKQPLYQVSYTPVNRSPLTADKCGHLCQRAWARRDCSRKEVIQPHLPIRLPCYDFTPVTNPAVVIALLAVRLTTSGRTRSHGVTGGVYKTRERIHRDMLIHDY